MIETICHARQFSDMMSCPSCELQWDTNDPEPPVCPRAQAAYERHGEPPPRRAPAAGWPAAETTVPCPLCDGDSLVLGRVCLACGDAGRVTAARAEQLKHPVRGKTFAPHWVVICVARWQRGFAEDFRTRTGAPPYLHGTELSAIIECKRLSEVHPGKRFAVYSSGFSAKIAALVPAIPAEQELR